MSKLSFYLRTDGASCAFLGPLLQAEGHDVLLYSDAPGTEFIMRDIVPRAKSKTPPDDAIVIFDAPGHGAEGKALRQKGHLVIGGNAVEEKLELKRGAAIKIFEKAGLTVPESKHFTSLAEGVAFLKRHSDDTKWYFKADDNRASALTHGDKAKELLEFITYAGENPALKADLGAFILQKEIAGTEVSTEGWYHYKRGWTLPFNGTLEEKAFLTGGLGEKTGCQSNVVWTYNEEEPLIALRTVQQMTDFLKEAEFIGPFDLNAIVDKKGVPHVLEASPRLGFDAFQALLMLLEPGTIGEQLEAFAAGELDEFSIRHDALAFTLRVTIPPYPVDNPKEAARKRGLRLDSRLLDHPDRIFLHDVMAIPGEDGETRAACAGADGYLCAVGAIGDDLEELRQEVLDVCKELNIPDKQHKLDPLTKPDEICAETRWHALRSVGLLRWGPPDLVDDPFPDEDEESEEGQDPEQQQATPADDDEAPFVEDL